MDKLVPLIAPKVTLSSKSPTTLHVQWNELPLDKTRGVVIEHRLYFRKYMQASYNVQTIKAGNEYTFTGLIPKQKYEVRVLSGTKAGFPALSEEVWPWLVYEMPDILTSQDPNKLSDFCEIVYEGRTEQVKEVLENKDEDSYAEELDILLANGNVKRPHPERKNQKSKRIKQAVKISEDEVIIVSPAESSGDCKIIFQSPKDSQRFLKITPSFKRLKEVEKTDSGWDAEKLDNFNLSGISDDDFDLKISTKDKKGNSANPSFFCHIKHKPKKTPQLLKLIKREYPHGSPIDAKPCTIVNRPKRQAQLLHVLKREYPPEEPIVGLNEIREFEVTPKGNDFSYDLACRLSFDCLACGLNFSMVEIVKHIISLKHRAEYLNLIDYPRLEMAYGDCPRVKRLMKNLCKEVQNCRGMGKPAVIKKISPKGMSSQAEESGTSKFYLK